MIDYLIAIAIFTGIYGFIALGLNVQWGLTGLINLGQVAFFAIGAYGTALLSKAGLPFLVALAIGAVAAGAVGAAVALLTPRLREDYLAIVTLGFSEFVRLIFLNEQWLAGGPDGIAGIPRPFAMGSGGAEAQFLGLVVLLLGIALWLCLRIERLPFGRVLRAIREDETVVASVGKPPLAFKLRAFVIGAMLAGVGGGFFAVYLTYISPDMFEANVSIFVLVAILLGREGSSIATLGGIAIVAVLLEGTRLLKDYIYFFDGVQLAAVRLILLGLALMTIVLVRYSPPRRPR